jgi:hypothetical protein
MSCWKFQQWSGLARQAIIEPFGLLMIMTTLFAEVSINPGNEENFYQNIAVIILSMGATFDVTAVAPATRPKEDKGGKNRDSHIALVGGKRAGTLWAFIQGSSFSCEAHAR